jgi:hypothetical protein
LKCPSIGRVAGVVLGVALLAGCKPSRESAQFSMLHPLYALGTTDMVYVVDDHAGVVVVSSAPDVVAISGERYVYDLEAVAVGVATIRLLEDGEVIEEQVVEVRAPDEAVFTWELGPHVIAGSEAPVSLRLNALGDPLAVWHADMTVWSDDVAIERSWTGLLTTGLEPGTYPLELRVGDLTLPGPTLYVHSPDEVAAIDIEVDEGGAQPGDELSVRGVARLEDGTAVAGVMTWSCWGMPVEYARYTFDPEVESTIYFSAGWLTASAQIHGTRGRCYGDVVRCSATPGVDARGGAASALALLSGLLVIAVRRRPKTSARTASSGSSAWSSGRHRRDRS